MKQTGQIMNVAVADPFNSSGVLKDWIGPSLHEVFTEITKWKRNIVVM